MSAPDGECVYRLTPHRDGTVTFWLEAEGWEPRHVRVRNECLYPGSVDGLGCPEWLVNWMPRESR